MVKKKKFMKLFLIQIVINSVKNAATAGLLLENTPTLYILIFTTSPKYKDIANFIPNYKLGGIVKHQYG